MVKVGLTVNPAKANTELFQHQRMTPLGDSCWPQPPLYPWGHLYLHHYHQFPLHFLNFIIEGENFQTMWFAFVCFCSFFGGIFCFQNLHILNIWLQFVHFILEYHFITWINNLSIHFTVDRCLGSIPSGAILISTVKRVTVLISMHFNNKPNRWEKNFWLCTSAFAK